MNVTERMNARYDDMKKVEDEKETTTERILPSQYVNINQSVGSGRTVR
jgi:hypothetical protein